VNYIKEAEEILKYHRDLFESVDKMREEISRLITRQGPSSLNAIALEPTGIHGGSKQDETYNVLFKIKTLTESRERTLAKLESIKVELEEINQEPGCENYGTLLRKWYIQGDKKEDIAKMLGYSSVQSTYVLKDRAIRKFAIRHFGLNAMNL